MLQLGIKNSGRGMKIGSWSLDIQISSFQVSVPLGTRYTYLLNLIVPRKRMVTASSVHPILGPIHNLVRKCVLYSYLATCKTKQIKGTVRDKKNIQITLAIKKNTFQSQHVSFSSKKLHNFDSKTTF